MTDRPDETRVYLRRGKRAHIVNSPDAAKTRACARCGRGPGWGGVWLGTGSMSEHEHAKALPLCQATRHDVAAQVQAAGKWMCPHCRDWFDPDDEEGPPPVCYLCRKAGRT